MTYDAYNDIGWGNKSLLYISMVDVSMPRGPAVNEREFIISMQRIFPGRLKILIPDPQHDMPRVDLSEVSFIGTYDRNILSLAKSKISILWRLPKYIFSQYDLSVIRLAPYPWFATMYLTTSGCDYVVKHASPGLFDSTNKLSGATHVIENTLNYLDNKVLRYLFKKANMIEVCTKKSRQTILDIEKMKSEKVKVVQNATNIRRFVPKGKDKALESISVDADGPVVGYVGGQPSYRAGKQLLRVYSDLVREYPSIKFLLVGSGENMSIFKKRIESLGIEGRFVMPGIVSYSKVPTCINAMDVCVAFNSAQRVSKVGNSYQKIRQYLACGRPVVSGRGAEFLADQGIGSVVDPDDEGLLATKLSKWVARMDNQRRYVIKKTRSYAEKYLCTERTTKKRMSLWGEILSRN